MDVPWAAFFVAAVGTEGATAAWDRAIRVSSDANPGIRILWLRSGTAMSITTREDEVVRLTKMKLEIFDFERIAAAMFCQSTAKVGDWVDKLVGDL
jgi:hypothetical protein